MKTKLIDVTVKVPSGEMCDPRYCKLNYFGNCELFDVFLKRTKENRNYEKCQACKDALERSDHEEEE